MAKFDWEKANRDQRKRPKGSSKRAKQSAFDRQQAMALFVFRHNIVCFKCSRSDVPEWARTGFSKRGPWAICKTCVKR